MGQTRAQTVHATPIPSRQVETWRFAVELIRASAERIAIVRELQASEAAVKRIRRKNSLSERIL